MKYEYECDCGDPNCSFCGPKMRKPKLYLNCQDFGECMTTFGALRNYEVSGEGDTITDFIKSITIVELEDGVDKRCYGYEEATNDLQRRILIWAVNSMEG